MTAFEGAVGQQPAGAQNGPGAAADRVAGARVRSGRGLHDLPGQAESFEFAGLVWAFVAGAWPMAHPAPVMATVLAEPQFAPMRVDFTFVTRRMLTVVLDGLTLPR